MWKIMQIQQQLKWNLYVLTEHDFVKYKTGFSFSPSFYSLVWSIISSCYSAFIMIYKLSNRNATDFPLFLIYFSFHSTKIHLMRFIIWTIQDNHLIIQGSRFSLSEEQGSLPPPPPSLSHNAKTWKISPPLCPLYKKLSLPFASCPILPLIMGQILEKGNSDSSKTNFIGIRFTKGQL